MQADLPAAIRARDPRRVSALRTTLAALANAETVDDTIQPGRGVGTTDVARKDLTEDDAVAIVVGTRDEYRNAADEMAALGEHRRAADLRALGEIVDSYL